MVGTSRKLFLHEQKKLVLEKLPPTEMASHQKEVEKEKNRVMGERVQRSEAVHIDTGK